MSEVSNDSLQNISKKVNIEESQTSTTEKDNMLINTMAVDVSSEEELPVSSEIPENTPMPVENNHCDAEHDNMEEIINQKCLNFLQKSAKVLMEDEIKTKTEVDNLPIDMSFIDDGIEFVDDGIEFIDEDEDLNNKCINSGIEPATGSQIEKKEVKQECEDDDVTSKFDLKLLMNPVVYTTKLDHMNDLKCNSFDTVRSADIIQCILIQSKPVSKEIADIKEIKQEHHQDLLGSDHNSQNDDLFKQDFGDVSSESSDMNITENQRVTLFSDLLQKPRSRSYNPVQLCKNPDFNTRLKRLTVGFFSHARNRQLLKACKPMTIDVDKAFESKLINDTIYLKCNRETVPLAKQPNDEDHNREQSVSVIPSVMPVQCLIDSTKININDLLRLPPSRLDSNGPLNAASIVADLPERNRVINLPDIANIRRINQRLLTAEVTPIQVNKTGDVYRPPVQIVASNRELCEQSPVEEKFIQTPDVKRETQSVPNMTCTAKKPTVLQNDIKPPVPEVPLSNVDSADICTRDTKQGSERYFNSHFKSASTLPIDTCTNLVNSLNKTETTRSMVNHTEINKIDQYKNNKTYKDKISKKTTYVPLSRQPLSWRSKNMYVVTPDSLLTSDTLLKILYELNEDMTEYYPFKKNKKLKKISNRSGNIELSSKIPVSEEQPTKEPGTENEVDAIAALNKNDQEQKPAKKATEGRKQKAIRVPKVPKEKKPRKTVTDYNGIYCCWAREKLNNLATTVKHLCPLVCKCCCRFNLVEVIIDTKNPINNVSLQSTADVNKAITLSDDEDDDKLKRACESIEAVVQQSRICESVESTVPLQTTVVVPLVDNLCEVSENNPISQKENLSSNKEVPLIVDVPTLPQKHTLASSPPNTKQAPVQPRFKVYSASSSQKPNSTVDCPQSEIRDSVTKQDPVPRFKVYSACSSQKPNSTVDCPQSEIIRDSLKKQIPVQPRIKVYLASSSQKTKSPEDSPQSQIIDSLTKQAPIQPQFKVCSCLSQKPHSTVDCHQSQIIIDGSKTCSSHKTSAQDNTIKEKTLYFDNKDLSSKLSVSPIYVGKNKILLSTVKFPPKDKISPNQYGNIEVPKLVPILPKVCNILSPSGEVTNTGPELELNSEQLSNLTAVRTTLQQQEINSSIVTQSPGLVTTIDNSQDIDKSVVSIENVIPQKENVIEELKSAVSVSDIEVDSCLKHPEDTIGTITNERIIALEQVKASDGVFDDNNLKETLNDDVPTCSKKMIELNDSHNDKYEQNISLPDVLNKKASEEAISNNVCNDNINFTNTLHNDTSQTNMSILPENSDKEALKSVESNTNNDHVTSQSLNNVIENSVSDANKSTVSSQSKNANKKTILSDLMEMSGISAEDTAPVFNNDVQQDLIPLSGADTASNLPPVNVINALELGVITSYAELKYACENNGQFFKLDLITGVLTPIKVCIKKNTKSKEAAAELEPKSIIDLTDEIDDSNDIQNTSNLNTSPDKLKRPYYNRCSTQSLLMKSKTIVDNTVDKIKKDKVKPLKLFKSVRLDPPILKRKRKHRADKYAPNVAVLSNKTKKMKQSRKQTFGKVTELINLEDSDAPMEEEYLIDSFDSDNSVQNITDKVNKINNDSDCSSDDEPLAKKVKRLMNTNSLDKESVDKEISEVGESKNMQNVSDNVFTTVRSVGPVDNIENATVALLSVYSDSDSSQDACILGV